MDVNATKQAIAAVVKQNGVGSITGPNMQTTLFRLLDDVNNGKSDKLQSSASGYLISVDANGNNTNSGVSVASVSGHLSATNNPHSVTKSQVGLSNVDNTSDINKPVSTAQATAIGVVDSALTAHKNRTDNPHGVTKVQVGLGNVDNTSDLGKPISTATQTALDAKADASNLSAHTNNTANPHNVTKTQVGLGNVDNTADLDKPVSSAMLTELAKKQDTNAVRLAAWKSLYGNFDLSNCSISDLSTFINYVLTKQGQGVYTSEAPFLGIMLPVKAYTSADPNNLIALAWCWGGECYGKKWSNGEVVHHGIIEAYNPDFNFDYNHDFLI